MIQDSASSGEQMPFKVGDLVGVKCEVQPGPFSGELLVTIETVEGAISGFIRESELRRDGDQWQVRGKVCAVHSGSLEVWIKGSFFTTNGLASVPAHLARAA
jgi:hypothetical protein